MNRHWVAWVLLAIAPAAARAEPVRVMSFNIRYGTARDGDNRWDARRQLLVDTIQQFDPDLLGTQETLAFQRDQLAERLPGYTVFGVGRDDGQAAGEMAAVFFRTERFEQIAGGTFWLSPTPEAIGKKGWDAALPRVATWLKLRDRRAPAAPPVLIVNTHFDHQGRTARIESAKLLRRQLETLGQGCRWIVTGDFNAGEGTEPHAALFAGPGPRLIDTFRAVNPTRGPAEGTYHDFDATKTGGPRIDWIGCSPEWEVRAAGIDRLVHDGRAPSDHFPVTAVLRAVDPSRPATVRVLCFNIHHGRGADGKIDLLRLARVIRGADPDFVALQEVDCRTRRSGGIDQTAELARLTGLHAAFGRAIDFEGGQYGQALLSRLPLAEPTVHTLPGEKTDEQRIAFAARTTVLGREIALVTTHLHHRSPAARERQAARLHEVIGAGDVPTILAGDFNTGPDTPPMAVLARHWSVATADAGLLTYPASRPNRQIDFILTRPAPAFRVIEARVIDDAVTSDHRPVLAVFTLGEPPRVLPPYSRPTLIAHRGASADAPEHTLAAYRLALKHGADFVEPDVQLTKDGVLVCLHDAALERTTDVARVFPDRASLIDGKKTWLLRDFTLAEVQRLDAGSWKGPEFAGARVPTLQQMIDEVRGQAGIIPEVKAAGRGIEAALMACLRANRLDQPGADAKTPVVVQSFHAESLKLLRREHGCRLPLVYLVGDGDAPLEQLRSIREFADGVGPKKSVVLARPAMVRDAHALGLSVTVWTFRAGQTAPFPDVRAEMRHFLRDLGVDAVFTDNPHLFPREW